MDLQLKDKTALVTGASMGIGNAVARALAAEGVRICIVARRRPLLEELASRITNAGGQQPAVAELDLMEDGAPERLAEFAQDQLGRVDILANCGGGSRLNIPIDAPESEWEETHQKARALFRAAEEAVHFAARKAI